MTGKAVFLLIFCIISRIFGQRYQLENNSFVIWLHRDWYEPTWMYGGFFYGYSFAEQELRPTVWTKRTTTYQPPDNYMTMDISDPDNPMIYMIDKWDGGYYAILKINPYCKENTTGLYYGDHINEYCTETLWTCTEGETEWYYIYTV